MLTRIRNLPLSLLCLPGLGLPLLASSLHGQAPVVGRVIPKGALVCFEVQGPDALRKAFAKTRFGEMCAGPEIRALAKPLWTEFEAFLKTAPADLQLDPLDMVDAILAYGGRVSLALFADENGFRRSERDPRMTGVLSLGPDGKADLGKMCKAVVKLAEQDPGAKLEDIKVGKRQFLTVGLGEVPRVCEPFMHEGQAVFLVAENLKQAIPWFLDAKPHGGPALDAPLAVRIDLKAFFEMAKSSGGEAPEQADLIFRAMGMDAINSGYGTVTAAGPYVRSRFSLEFNNKDRGMLAAMFDLPGGTPKLGAYLAADNEAAYCLPLNLRKFVAWGRRFVRSVDPAGEENIAGGERQFQERFGIRLQQDVIDQLGRGMIMGLRKIPSEHRVENGDAIAEFDGALFGLALKDGPVFGKSLERIIRKQGLHAARKKSKFQGITIYRLNFMMMVDVAYAVTDDALLVSLGKAGPASIRAALTHRAAPGSALEKMPAAVRERMALLSKNPSVYAWTDVRGQGTVIQDMQKVIAELPPQAASESLRRFMAVLGQVVQLFPKYGMSHSISAGYEKSGAWIMESVF